MSLSLVTVRAVAQPVTDPAAADELFEHGKDLLQAGDWPGACAKFRASMSLDPAVGTMVKIARCDEHERKLALALHDYEAAIQLNRTKPGQTAARRAELEAFARAALDQLEPRVPRLRIVIAHVPPGLRVLRGAEELPLGALGEALPVDPGVIEVVVSAPGYLRERRVLELRESAREELAFELTPEGQPSTPAAATPPGPPLLPPPPAPTRSGRALSPSRIAAYAVGGAGLVTLGVAGYFGIKTLTDVNEASSYCVNDVCKPTGYGLIGDARGTQTAGLVLLGAGAAMVGVSAVILLTTRSRSSAVSRVSLLIGPSGGSLRGSF